MTTKHAPKADAQPPKQDKGNAPAAFRARVVRKRSLFDRIRAMLGAGLAGSAIAAGRRRRGGAARAAVVTVGGWPPGERRCR